MNSITPAYMASIQPQSLSERIVYDAVRPDVSELRRQVARIALIVTAIFISIATLGVGLILVSNIYEAYIDYNDRIETTLWTKSFPTYGKPGTKASTHIKAITSTSWYETEHVQRLLTHFVHNPSINVFAPISGTNLGGNTLRVNLEDDQLDYILRESNGQLPLRQTLIPVNLGNSHWVAVELVHNHANRARPTIRYFDSMGNAPPADLRASIEGVYREAQWEISTRQVQHDGYQCGAWMVDCLRQRAGGAFDSALLNPGDIANIRAQHRQVLEGAPR